MEILPGSEKFVTPELAAALKNFQNKFDERSFSKRHPELGKMIKCQICSRRHRSSEVCKQRHVVELKVLDYLTDFTHNQYHGKASVAKKRINPHYSKKRLQLLEKTRELYPLHENLYTSTETKAVELVTMEMARREARQFLEEKRNAKRSKIQDAERRSRRINAGLLEGNSRIGR